MNLIRLRECSLFQYSAWVSIPLDGLFLCRVAGEGAGAALGFERSARMCHDELPLPSAGWRAGIAAAGS